MRALDAELIEEGTRVVGDRGNVGFGWAGERRRSVSAQGKAHDAKVRCESRDLCVPHRQRAAERVQQQQRRVARVTLAFVVKGTVTDPASGHDQ